MSDQERQIQKRLEEAQRLGTAKPPVFCIRYQTEGMDRTPPLRIVQIRDNRICAGRPCDLENGQSCRLLLYCNDPNLSIWVDAEVTDPLPPFDSNQNFRGIHVVGQGRFLIHDYLEAVGESMRRFFLTFEQYQHLESGDCFDLARIAGTRELEKSEVLYKVGEKSPDENDLYIVTGGNLKAYKSDPTDPTDNIAALSIGQFAGEMRIIVADRPHSASVAAVDHSWLIQFSRTGFWRFEADQPKLFIKIYKLIAETVVRRLARTTARWKKYERFSQ